MATVRVVTFALTDSSDGGYWLLQWYTFVFIVVLSCHWVLSNLMFIISWKKSSVVIVFLFVTAANSSIVAIVILYCTNIVTYNLQPCWWPLWNNWNQMTPIQNISGWWFEPLWKIWVRQLGLWHSQNMKKWNSCSKPPTRYAMPSARVSWRLKPALKREPLGYPSALSWQLDWRDKNAMFTMVTW